MSILVTIPDHDASRSKMSKKGWKCWAKCVTGVAAKVKNGYDYEGEFVDSGSREMDIGDIVLLVDDSAENSIRVVISNSAGKGVLITVANGSLPGMAATTRKYLAMSIDERVAAAAKNKLASWAKTLREAQSELEETKKWKAENPDNTMSYRGNVAAAEEKVKKCTIDPVVIAYYTSLANPTASTPNGDDKAAAIAQIKALMAQHAIDIPDLV